MDDEEIVKQFRNLHYEEFEKLPTEDIVEQKHFENAAIRLYRMAEKKTAEDLQETLRLAGIERESAIEQARASEREIIDNGFEEALRQVEQRGYDNGKKLSKEFHCIKHGWACERCESCEKEAYAKGKADENALFGGKTPTQFYQEGFEQGYKKGQAELMAKLRKKIRSIELRNQLLDEYGESEEGAIECLLEDLESKFEDVASESLEKDKSIKGVGSYSIKPQPNATVADTGEHSGSNPKPEKPKTKKKED